MIENLTPLELAERHLNGCVQSEDGPECQRCHADMATGDDLSEPTAFCFSCVYEVFDTLSKEVISLRTERLLEEERRALSTEQHDHEAYDDWVRMTFSFIEGLATAASQPSIGALSETQVKMIDDIKRAACGTVPNWFVKSWEKSNSREK